MKLADDLTLSTSPGLSAKEFEASRQFVVNWFAGYESKDPSWASSILYEDSQWQMDDLPLLVGLEPMSKFFAWTHEGMKIAFEVRSINVLPEQTIVGAYATITFAKGSPMTRSWLHVYERKPLETKVKHTSVHGDVIEVFHVATVNAGRQIPGYVLPAAR